MLSVRSITCSLLLALAALTIPHAFTEEPAKPDLYDVVLLSFESKIQAVKAVHEIAGLGIKESKDLVENLPKPILAGSTKDQAESAVRHAVALGCKAEMRAAKSGASVAVAPQRFDLILWKVDPAKKDVAVQTVNELLKASALTAEQNLERARKTVDSAPALLLANVGLGEADLKIPALTAAGCIADVLSSGGVETGGYSVVLTKFEKDKKIMAVSIVRNATGLNLARAKNLVEAAPQTVKTKITKEEAEKIKAALEAQQAVVEIKEAGK